MKLFFIGNGFDLDHKLKTEYKHFRLFLVEEYKAKEKMEFVIEPSTTLMPDGGVVPSLADCAQLLLTLIDDVAIDSTWREFEKYLGEIDYSLLFDTDLDDDNPFHTAYNNEDRANDYRVMFSYFNNLFSNWIQTIDTSSGLPAKKKYIDIFNESSIFISFNYTDTLISLYNIKRESICYIHGDIINPIFGHGNNGDAVTESLLLGNADITYNEMKIALYKDVFECIHNNASFLEKVDDVDEIFFIGWSFSDIDIEYLNYVREKVGEKHIIIHLTAYDYEDNEKYQLILHSLAKFNYEFGEMIPKD